MHDTIRTHRIEIVDKDDNLRGAFFAGDDDEAALILLDKNGTQRVEMVIDAADSCGIQVKDHEGYERIALEVWPKSS